MLATTTLELKIPVYSLTVQPTQMRRDVVRHLLLDGQLKMPDALVLLSPEEQACLVKVLIDDAAHALVLATQLSDFPLRQHYWQQYNNLLAFLFYWHTHWSTHHSELVSVLQTATRRYPVQDLTAERAKIMQKLTLRLHDDRLDREDVFSAEHALQDVGWDTVLDLSPVASQLFQLYAEELGRA